MNKSDKAVFLLRWIARWWSRSLLWVAGVKYTIEGIENIPEHDNICFVSNHQGHFDIPLLLASTDKLIGFIAKKELGKFPIFNFWVKELGCVFIDRSKKEESVRLIAERLESIKKGRPMLLFPEGTRSKGRYPIGKFKTGGLKTVLQANVPILPVTIDGSFACFEKQGKITANHVRIVIHPLRTYEGMDDQAKRQEVAKIHELIASEVRSVPAAV